MTTHLRLGDKIQFDEDNGGLFDAMRKAGLLKTLSDERGIFWGREIEAKDGSDTVIVEAHIVDELP